MRIACYHYKIIEVHFILVHRQCGIRFINYMFPSNITYIKQLNLRLRIHNNKDRRSPQTFRYNFASYHVIYSRDIDYGNQHYYVNESIHWWRRSGVCIYGRLVIYSAHINHYHIPCIYICSNWQCINCGYLSEQTLGELNWNHSLPSGTHRRPLMS